VSVRRLFLGICTLLLVVLTPLPGHALEVAEGVIATSVENRQPVGTADHFPATIGTLYCFSRLVGAGENATVTHRWYHGDRKMAEVELPVRSGDWRTWSSKTLLPRWQGPWRVDIVDASGNLLQSVPFRLE